MAELEARTDSEGQKAARERRIALIVNLQARRGAFAYDRAKQLLTEKGFTITEALPVHDPARVPDIVAAAVSRGHRFIVIGGGDGTISASFGVLALTDAVCGILPLGTANSFARSLHLPLELDAAIDVLDTGRAVKVDLGRIDGDYFGTAAAVGLSAAISRQKPHLLKKVMGRLAYPVVAGFVLPRFRPFRCTIRYPGGEAKSWDAVLELRIANASYEGGVEAAPDAAVTSGDLVVHMVTGRSKWRLVSTWGKIVAGVDPDGHGFHSFRAASFHLQTEPSHDINVDGEAATRTPVDVSVARGALTVMVPAQSSAANRRS